MCRVTDIYNVGRRKVGLNEQFCVEIQSPDPLQSDLVRLLCVFDQEIPNEPQTALLRAPVGLRRTGRG